MGKRGTHKRSLDNDFFFLSFFLSYFLFYYFLGIGFFFVMTCILVLCLIGVFKSFVVIIIITVVTTISTVLLKKYIYKKRNIIV